MSLKTTLCSKFAAIGIQKVLVRTLVDHVYDLQKNNGPQWTVNRLKDYKLIYLKSISKEEVKSSTWVTTNKRGFPNNPFGVLMKRYDFTKVIHSLQVYTDFVSHEVTDVQKRKFLDSLNAPADTEGSTLINQIKNSVDVCGKKRVKPSYFYTIWNFPWSDSRRAPLLQTGSTVSENSLSWLPQDVNSPAVNHLVTNYPHLSGEIGLEGKEFSSIRSKFRFDEIGVNLTVGRISVIQEPGFKARVIANPSRTVQLMLKGLQKATMRDLRKIKQDCTHDQDAGKAVVQKWLQGGKRVYCVDLSDATNHFPLSYQVNSLVKRYDVGDDLTCESLQCFVEASRLQWQVPKSLGSKPVTWKRGQPLGLAPSFPVFALSHHDLMAESRKKLGLLERIGCDYVILGDDVAIVGQPLYESYRKLLKSLQVPVSESKCLISDRIGEFAGAVITHKEIVSPGKWKTISDRNYIELMRNLGPQATSMLRPLQRRVMRLLGPLPEMYGGLGWNPKGESASVRKDRYESVFGPISWLDKTIGKVNPLALMRKRRNVLAYQEGISLTGIEETRYGKRILDTPTRSILDRLHKEVQVYSAEMPLGVETTYVPSVIRSDPRSVTRSESLIKQIKRKPDLPTQKLVKYNTVEEGSSKDISDDKTL